MYRSPLAHTCNLGIDESNRLTVTCTLSFNKESYLNKAELNSTHCVCEICGSLGAFSLTDWFSVSLFLS